MSKYSPTIDRSKGETTFSLSSSAAQSSIDRIHEFDVHMSFKANKQELNKGKDILISGQFGFGAVPLVGSTVVTVVAVTVVVVVSVVVVSGIARS